MTAAAPTDKDLFEFEVSRRTVTRRLSWVILGQIGIRARGIIVLPLLARLLGTEAYGSYTAAIAAAGLVIVFAQFNIPDSSGRLVIGAPNRHIAYSRITRIRQLGLRVSLLLALGGLVAAVVLRNPLLAGTAFYASSQGAIKVAALHYEYFQHLGRLTRLRFLADWLGVAIGLALALHLGALGMLVGGAIGTSVLALSAWRTFGLRPASSDPGFWPKAIRLTLPLMPVAFAQWALFSIDILILYRNRGPQETGIYSASYSLASTALILPIAIGAIWPATSQRLLKQSHWHLRRAMTRATAVVVLVATLMVLGAFLLQSVVTPLLGTSFESAATTVPVLVAGFCALGVAKLAEGALYAGGRVTAILAAYVMGGAINLVLNLLFIPTNGMGAAAWATFAGYGFTASLLLVMSMRKRESR
jgi:O-antigen/teichoic acid export membrane protein